MAGSIIDRLMTRLRLNPSTRRRRPRTDERPKMVFAGADGTIYDHPELEMAGVDGGEATPVPARDLVPLPRGSDLFVLPDRNPIGIDPTTGRAVEYTGDDQVKPVSAV